MPSLPFIILYFIVKFSAVKGEDEYIKTAPCNEFENTSCCKWSQSLGNCKKYANALIMSQFIKQIQGDITWIVINESHCPAIKERFQRLLKSPGLLKWFAVTFLLFQIIMFSTLHVNNYSIKCGNDKLNKLNFTYYLDRSQSYSPKIILIEIYSNIIDKGCIESLKIGDLVVLFIYVYI